MRGGGLFLLLVACGGATASSAQGVTICPAGSVLDPGKNQCVAMEVTRPIVTEDPIPGPIASTSTIAITTPPPTTTGFAIDVKCTFPQGWVSLVPVSKYPKDDQFLMQALIGFTKEPSFWTGLAEYRAIQPFAAKRCNATGTTRLMAPSVGDYYLVAGQEGAFAARNTYTNNGVRKKLTVNATTSMTLAPADLTHTWVCISCPWVVFRGERGRDLEPFVVLANRRGRSRRGSDRHAVAHVPVVDGHIVMRVMEVESEETHLESIAVFVNGQRLSSSARTLFMRPHTQATYDFVVPGVTSGFIDALVEATGYYDPL